MTYAQYDNIQTCDMWWHVTTYGNTLWQAEDYMTSDDRHAEDDRSLDDRCPVWQHLTAWRNFGMAFALVFAPTNSHQSLLDYRIYLNFASLLAPKKLFTLRRLAPYSLRGYMIDWVRFWLTPNNFNIAFCHLKLVARAPSVEGSAHLLNVVQSLWPSLSPLGPGRPSAGWA